MRILIVSNYYPPFEIGGWGQLTYDVTQLLRARGHTTHVLASSYRQDELVQPESGVSRDLHLESPDHVHYRPIYTWQHRRHEAENRQTIERLAASFAPDIVYVNGMWNLPHNVAHTLERLCPGRVIYYMASYWPAEMDAHTAYWTDPTANPWLRWPKKAVGQFVRRFWLTVAPRNQLDFRLVLCVSDYMRRNIVAQAGIPEGQTRVVYNGIDPQAFPMRSLNTMSPETRLLYAGRLSPDKGVHIIVQALAHLKQKQPDAPICLSIVGAGSPEYEAHLQQLVAQENVVDWVQFKPRVPREEMAHVLAAHDVLIFSSIWPEPLARMVQEAMACGLIVIGTTTGGTPEILHDGHNGLTYPAEDAAALAQKIEEIANDAELRRRLAVAARQTVEKQFTMDRMIDELEMYFEQIVSETAVPAV